MERDPVCGMAVEPQKAAGKSDHHGRTYYFCSPDCKRQFDRAPERYTAQGRDGPTAASGVGDATADPGKGVTSMAEVELPTVVGVFEDRHQAERAVGELRRAGFGDDRVGLLVREQRTKMAPPAGCDTNTKAEEGATAGLLTGGAVGALFGAAASLIPGVGPVVAAGVLAGAVGGAVMGGVVGVFVGMGIPEDEARLYECELSAGRALVTVRAEDRAAEAVAVLRRCGAFDASKGEPPPVQTTGLS